MICIKVPSQLQAQINLVQECLAKFVDLLPVHAISGILGRNVRAKPEGLVFSTSDGIWGPNVDVTVRI